MKEVRIENIKVQLASEAGKVVETQNEKRNNNADNQRKDKPEAAVLSTQDSAPLGVSMIQLSKTRFQEHIFKENIIRDQDSRENFVEQLRQNYNKLTANNPSLKQQIPDLSISRIQNFGLNSRANQQLRRPEQGLKPKSSDLDFNSIKTGETLGISWTDWERLRC